MPRRQRGGSLVWLGLFLLALPGVAHALSTADLADPWQVAYVATPTTTFTGAGVQAYKGTVSFSDTGVASGTLVVDEFTPGALTFTVTGSLAVSAQGLVAGTLTLTGPQTRSLEVAEGRLLANRHTIVGAATLTRPGVTETGLITLVRLTAQTFSRPADLVGDWHYHEVSPSNALNAGDADWTRGQITFHTNGCSVAELFFADGTVREALEPGNLTSFG